MKFFCHFIEFGSYVFYEIAYNDSLQQCLTSSRGNTNEKKIEAQRAIIKQEIRFFCNFLKFATLAFFDIAQIAARDNV